LINDDKNDNCPDPLGAPVTEIALRPIPELTPSPIHLPPPPSPQQVAVALTVATLIRWAITAGLLALF
jgi:hypothetical protein